MTNTTNSIFNLSITDSLLLSSAGAQGVYAEIFTPIQLVQEQLTRFFTEPDYLPQLAIPFSANAGTEAWTSNAESLRSSILDGSYSIRLELRSSSELEGALGAYSATGTTGTPTIYINGDWFATASTEQVTAVLLEELGHSFDQILNNGGDSVGDEGAIFSNLVLGNEFDLNTLQQEIDVNVINIDGQEVQVENAISAPSVSFNNAYTASPGSGGKYDLISTLSNDPRIFQASADGFDSTTGLFKLQGNVVPGTLTDSLGNTLTGVIDFNDKSGGKVVAYLFQYDDAGVTKYIYLAQNNFTVTNLAGLSLSADNKEDQGLNNYLVGTEPPIASISVTPTAVNEDGTGSLVFTVELSRLAVSIANNGTATNIDTTINLSITGTAIDGTDYPTQSTTVTVLAGQTTATITIDPTDDTTFEPNETIILTLATGTGYRVSTTSPDATGTITNDDLPSITINSITNDSGVSSSDFITNDNNGLTVKATLSDPLVDCGVNGAMLKDVTGEGQSPWLNQRRNP